SPAVALADVSGDGSAHTPPAAAPHVSTERGLDLVPPSKGFGRHPALAQVLIPPSWGPGLRPTLVLRLVASRFFSSSRAGRLELTTEFSTCEARFPWPVRRPRKLSARC